MDRTRMINSLAELVSNPLTVDVDLSISIGGWHLYQLEDGRYAVSKFDARGKHESEFLYLDPFIAAARFVEEAVKTHEQH